MGTAETSERKLATMLFVDLCGFTELSRTADPEDVRLRTQPILDGLADIAARCGALIGPTEGDGFLAIFGLPAAHDDDPLRALVAAQQMRRFARSLASEDPGIHAGVATGEVFATLADGRWSVNGAAVNLASRLCDSAAQDEVMVDERCASLAGDRAEWGRRVELRLKGFSTPEVARVLSGLRDDPNTLGRLVGREAQVQLLLQALEDVAVTRRSRVISIVGEAGIGKTVLATSFSLNDPMSALCLYGRCQGFGGVPPLGPIVDAIRRSAPTSEGRDLEPTLVALGVKDASALSERWRYFVGDARRGPLNEAFSGRDRILQTLTRRLLAAIASKRPTILVVDDVHLAANDVIELVQSICDFPLPAALLVLTASRAPVLTGPSAELLRLGPVENSDAAEILKIHAGTIDAKIADQLTARTGGNPLFLKECAVLLRDAAANEGRAPSPYMMQQLPETVRLVLAARLDGLRAAEKSLLQAASTWGEEGPVQALELLARPWMPEVGRSIEGLFSMDDRGWQFAHSLVREVAYASVTKRDRLRRHHSLLQSPLLNGSQRAFHATAMVELDVPGDESERTGNLVVALSEVRAHATQVFAIEARAAYDAVVRISTLIERGAFAAPSDAFALLMIASAAAVELGFHQEGMAQASRAFMLVPDMDSPTAAAEAWIARGRCSTRLGDHEQARLQGERALELAKDSGSRATAGRALLLIGETFRYSSFDRWVEYLAKAFEAFESDGDKAGCAETARIAAYILSTGSKAAYEVWIDRAKTFTAPEDLRGRAWIARAEMFAANDSGRWMDAATLASDALSLGQDAGLRDIEFDARRMLLEACTSLGRADQSEDLIAALRDMAQGESGDSHMRMAAATSSARALQRWISPDAADDALAIAYKIAENLGVVERADCLLAYGDVLAERGDWGQALSSYAEVGALADAGEQPQLVLTARTRILRLRMATGEAVPASEIRILAGTLVDVESVGNLSILAAVWPDLVDMPADGGTPEVAALIAEQQGRHDDAVWAWTQLGNTCWLAAALDRVGNHERAEEVRAALRP